MTKGEIVLLALRKGGIASSSSLVQPTAAMMSDYLQDLDNMMAEWDGVRGIRIGYMFSDPEYGANTSDESGLPDWSINAVVYNLAVQILTDRSKPIKPSVQSAAFNFLRKLNARTRKPKKLQRPSIMFRGAGWKGQNYNRYYHEKDPELETSDGEIIIE